MENKKIKNATPTEYKNIVYRSTLEANCAKVFEEYSIDVKYEPYKITLLPQFTYNKENLKAITYTPDFVGSSFIVECKGFPNDNWHDKRKWIMHYLLENRPDVTFYEIHTVNQLKTLLKSIKYNMKEEWKPVVGFGDLYEVSNLGSVRSIQYHGNKRIKIMTQTSDKLGYKFVKLRDWYNNIAGSFPVHRLVAQAFIPNLDNKPEIDHIDTNPSNNVVTNLRWVTHLENQRNEITLERLRTSITKYNKSESHKKVVQETQGHSILQYDRKGNFIAEYPSMSEAAIILNTTACCIKRVCDGNRKYHRNWVFKYK